MSRRRIGQEKFGFAVDRGPHPSLDELAGLIAWTQVDRSLGVISSAKGQLRRSGATATNLLGAMAVILARAPPSDDDSDNPVRICQCIPMVPDKELFERRFGMRLVTGYGQTETSFVTLDTKNESRPGSCGRAHPDWEVAVVDDKDKPSTGSHHYQRALMSEKDRLFSDR